MSDRPDLIDLFGMIALILAIIMLAWTIQDVSLIRGGDTIGPI